MPVSSHSPQSSFPAPRTLVTGGAGFIGSHLVEHLLTQGHHVTVIDNLSTGRRENLPDPEARDGPGGGADGGGRLRFIEADLADALAALGPGERFDAIYHLAAAVGVKLVIDQPIRSIETNIFETAALLRFALSHGPENEGDRGEKGGARPAPTLIASSSEVYGKTDKSPFSEDDDVVYGPTTKSRWSYAASKAIDEYLALAHHAQHGLPAVVVRFFNTVGPRQIGNYGMVLPNFVSAALAGEPLVIHGDGAQTRCFCDVRDVVGALPPLITDPACHGRVFNLGSDRPISIAALADLVIATLGSRSTNRFVPYDLAYTAGFEDLKQRQPDLARIRAAIGFHPERTLDQTIRDLARQMAARPERPR